MPNALSRSPGGLLHFPCLVASDSRPKAAWCYSRSGLYKKEGRLYHRLDVLVETHVWWSATHSHHCCSERAGLATTLLNWGLSDVQDTRVSRSRVSG